MPMLEFKNPIPVIVSETQEEGLAIYVTSGGTYENDIWTIVLCEGGKIISVTINQIKIKSNKTFDIRK